MQNKCVSINMSMDVASNLWPELVEREYAYFDKTKKCLKVDEFNRVFRFRPLMIPDCAPVFFAGNVRQSPFCLLGLNPAYNEKNYAKERKIYNELGWEQTYVTFFDWALREKISSPYYSRFAVFLAGLLREEKPENREQRFQLLHENLVNLNLIPYHSTKISLQENFTEKQKELIKPYLKTLEELVILFPRKALVMNGAALKFVQKEIGFKENSAPVRVNEKLQVYIGDCFSRIAIWLDKFISGPSAAVTNEQLFDAGKRIKDYLKL